MDNDPVWFTETDQNLIAMEDFDSELDLINEHLASIAGPSQQYDCNNPKPPLHISNIPEHLEKAKRYWCDECNLNLVSDVFMRVHTVRCHVKFTCQNCFMVFKSVSGFEEHLRAHSAAAASNRIFHCYVCKRQWISLQDLTDHMKINHPFVICDKCDYLFYSAAGLRDHICHAADRKFICYNCRVLYTYEDCYIEHYNNCVMTYWRNKRK